MPNPSPANTPRAPAVPPARSLLRAAYTLPFLLIAALCITYAISPRFYLTYVLHGEHRETQAVEILTFCFGFLASILLFTAAAGLWRLEWSSGRIRGMPGGPIIIAVVALAALFFAGEEISWGQVWFGWETPEAFSSMEGRETNLHNADILISAQAAGGVFLIGVFFGLPVLWALRDRLPIPPDWRTAIAEGPVILTFASAFAWGKVKDAHYTLTSEEDRAASPLHNEFIWQINEQKELLFAAGLLLYGLFRIHAFQRLRAAQA